MAYSDITNAYYWGVGNFGKLSFLATNDFQKLCIEIFDNQLIIGSALGKE